LICASLGFFALLSQQSWQPQIQILEGAGYPLYLDRSPGVGWLLYDHVSWSSENPRLFLAGSREPARFFTPKARYDPCGDEQQG